MSLLKAKGDALYLKMRSSREQLVKKYVAGGTIRYDEALGIIPVGGNPAVSTAATTLGGTPVVNTGRREKRVSDMKEDGTVGTATGRVVLDFDAIKAANIADGITSGSMLDALKKRAAGKVIQLFANDAALRYGPCFIEEVECMIQLQDNLDGLVRNGVFPAFGPATQTGIIHSLPGLVENEGLSHRGLAKPVNYRGDVEYLKDPTSIWALTDASGLSMNLFGINSEIRMWGANQVIDLNGKRIGAHERPNRFAAFSSIIDLSNGHFAGLSTKGARNAHIFSSTGVGRLARCNHFAIRGHFVKGLLVEGIQSGDIATLNQGSYFGTAIFNDSQEIVFKDVHQEMINKAISNSSMALSHYAQLTNIEYLLGYFERPSTWNTASATTFPWMKWTDKAALDPDTFSNNKTSKFPVLKTKDELEASGVPSSVSQLILDGLKAMQIAHRKSMKSADDTYIQVNTGHGIIGKSFPMVANKMTDVVQIPRSVNLIAQNPKTADGVRYPDSMVYGFRVGSSSEGVGKLATEAGGTAQDIYILDCSFEGMHSNGMEAISMGAPGKGPYKTFNGNGLRPFGYTNAIEDAASIAPALMLMSKEAMEDVSPAYKLEVKPVDSFDTAAKAVLNTSKTGWTAKKAAGLYKGNDVTEASLCALEVIGLLKKYFTANGPKAILGGLDNSSLDIGILAWRKSMMTALDAYTANHVGLKGGFKGDIIQGHLPDGTLVDKYAHGEIYPWFVKKDLSIDIDKDVILAQPAVAASATKDRTLSEAYLGVELPEASDSIYKLKLVSKDTWALVTAVTEAPVTYEQCATLLGFNSASAGTLTGPVEYKLLRNFDGQNHVQKGIFGVRIDQASDVVVSNVVVKDVETKEAKAPVQGLGSVETQLAFGVNSDSRPESGVVEIHGVSFNGVTKGEIVDILVQHVESRGSVFPVEVAGESRQVEIESIRAEDVKAGLGGFLAQPYGEQQAIAAKIEFGCSEIELSKVVTKELVAARLGLAKDVQVETKEVKLS